MRYSLLIAAVLLMIMPVPSGAQKLLPVRKRELRTEATGLREAWSHVRTGDQYFAAGGVYYAKAYDEYLKALIYNPACARLNFDAGLTALSTDNKADAAGFLLKAYQLDNSISREINLLTGQALQYAGNFSGAIDELNKYLNSEKRKPAAKTELAKKRIEECRSALEIIKDTLKTGIYSLGPKINSSADEYSQVIASRGATIIFSSRRGLPRFSDYYKDSKFDENIFISYLSNGMWSDPLPAGREVTSVYCESPLFIDSDGSTLYLYAGYENGGDIMMSKMKKGQWGPPKRIPYKINTSKKETSFSISPSGNEICFVSEGGKPNLGGKDIFIITRNSKGKWSGPVNAGVGINTQWDEESPSFSRTGDTLWFSSRGHNSMGGFDVFYSVRTGQGGWSGAVNGGFPLNTQFDELFYLPSAVDDSLFYFVSNRSDGFGGLDIYKGEILPPPATQLAAVEPEPEPAPAPAPEPVVVVAPKPAEVIFYLNGKVTDSESGAPLTARIDVIETASGGVVASVTSSASDGSYSVRVPERKSYLMELRSQGYLSDLKHVPVPAAYSSEIFTFNISLAKVKVGRKVVLNNILFETGKAVLTQSSYQELNRLLAFMQDNPGVKVEISGHTDITGSLALNTRLSNDRARAVADYLTTRGIASTRIIYKGYGPSQPVATNANAEGRARNRRVEMKILEI